jgi:hypothetical protein
MGRLSKRQFRMAFEKQRRRNAIARPGCHEFIIICDGLKSDFNIGKIFRSAEAFGAQAVHLVGMDCFNPYPARARCVRFPPSFSGILSRATRCCAMMAIRVDAWQTGVVRAAGNRR